jgi:phosphoserine phosphatase RsbU/P
MKISETPISVMIVDDSPTVRYYLKSILEDTYEIHSCNDGVQAIQSYVRTRPEICLLDMNMPHMGGSEVIRHLRGELDDQDLYILVLTSDESSEKKSKALNEGANDYLVKPFDTLELLARISVAERQVRLTRNLRQAYATIYQEINEVAQLQRRLLPTTALCCSNMAVQSLYLPSTQASGDYFDYFSLPGGGVRVVMADVSGHGAKAAFIMSMVRTMVRFSDAQTQNLSALFTLINEQLRIFVGEEGDFVTLFAADIHADQNSMTYINAGHTPALLLQAKLSPRHLQATMPALGIFDVSPEMRTEGLGEHATLFLFTDGCFEWEVSPGQRLELEEFQQRVAPVVDQAHVNLADLFLHLGFGHNPPLQDDASALWVRIGESAPLKTQEEE